MRKTIITGVAAIALAAAAITPSLAAQSQGGDINCEDVTYAEAQEILSQDPSDPHGLDRDGDGEACDSKAPDDGGNTTTPPPSDTTTTPPPAGNEQPSSDVDCADLTYAEAQEILSQDPSDPNRLDRDGDGIACESLADDSANDQGTDDATDDGLAPVPSPQPGHIEVTG